jgi:hypothetical protein
MAKGLAHLPTSRLVQGSNLNLAAWGNSLLCNSDGLKLDTSQQRLGLPKSIK